MASIATMHQAKQQARPVSPALAQIQRAIAGIARSGCPVLILEAELGSQASVAEGSPPGLIVSGRTPVDPGSSGFDRRQPEAHGCRPDDHLQGPALQT
jgi:hypothetical protein